MRDARKIQERVEIRLERSQIVWLTMGLMVVMALMFALGFMVGGRAARFDTTLESAASNPLERADAVREEKEQLEFYKKLTEKRAPVEEPVPEAKPAPKPEPQEKAEDVAPVPNEKPPEAPEASDTPIPEKAAPAPMENLAPSLKEAMVSQPTGTGEYTIQIAAFQTQGEADAFEASMKRKGYTPYIVVAKINNRGTWYRVRLGRFSDTAEAEKAKSILAGDDVAAWVVTTE
ncbi:SPOR domain-containing protein [Myxococcota bacterium]|nr:SPOR domain-containing protein [Myxococcota bacterium]